MHCRGKVWITTGANATGTAADAATAFASGYLEAPLHIAAKAVSPNTNGGAVVNAEALIHTRGGVQPRAFFAERGAVEQIGVEPTAKTVWSLIDARGEGPAMVARLRSV